MIALAGVAIHSKIYESSASLVYRGIREWGNCAAIAKVLKQDYPSSRELTRYRQEYEITRSLNIEGVVKAYSQQDYQRTLVILLEDFGGESLEYWMRQQSDFCPMPLSVFLNIAIALTNTLGRIHAANIIHKDINPGNIVLNPETGIVKIIDFGIATRFNRSNPTFKSPHELEGTLAYISPEQTGRMNRWLDYRTDFYSLGVTFYELLTGQLPFPTTDVSELVHCHIAKAPVPPHELNATIPQPISGLILKLMAKNAEDRYQSAWGIKADLEIFAQQLEQRDRIAPISLGLHDVSEQFHISQKLYGREAEIRTLLAAFDRVTEKERTQFNVEMVLVSGYAGVGKSALVQELYKPITAKQGYFISGKFDQFRQNVPYSAIVEALRKLVQQLLGESNERVQQWRSRLLTALGSNGQIIIDVIPEVELIVGTQPPVPEVGATEAQNRFNLTFRRFVRVFCAKEHPLAIFLDDLQWIDAATLKLIELILLDEQTQSLFLIGAYRDNEVTPAHPLILTLESLRSQGAILQDIILTPLTLESLSQLLAETLHHTAETVHSLAKTVSCKTEGNSFFVGEFLKLLNGENLLTFDAKQLSWQWNLAEIEAQDITDNVVELLLRQLQKLSKATQQILSIAACVGSEFDLETLALSIERNSEGIVCEKSPKAIFQDLLAAIQAGLIQPLSELDEDLLVQEYKFLHDRVQQAAYALIDESQKSGIHLQIGRNLLEKTSPDQRAERLFEIVDHLNFGTELIIEQSQRNEIAKLNLQAGQKALAATAYEAAFKYFNTGLKFLDVESWQREYDLTLVLHSEAAEAAYLSGHFDEMERLAEAVLNRAKTVLDTVKVYDSRIQAWMSWGEPKEALKTGLEVLQRLGISLVEAPSQLDVQAGLEETASRLAGREIEDLIDLPEMTEPVPLAAIYILVGIYSSAFISAPALMVLIICKIVNLSIAHGNAIWSPLGYVGYGMILCGVEQDFELGYRFGKLSLNLAKRSNNKRGNCKALMMVNIHIIPWKDHLKETFPGLAEGYHSGIESGEFESAGYCALNVCYNSFFAGHELTELEQQTAIYRKATHQIRREIPATYLAMLQQTIINLRGQSENPSRLVGGLYDEEQALSWTIAAKDGTGLHFFYSNKLILCYLFGEYEQAAKTANLAEPYLSAATSLFSVALFHFYDSLIVLSLWANASSSEKAPWLNRVNANQEKMQKWAEHAPMNFLHKYHLVKAEKARVLGQFLEAEEFYEQAIQGARENEYIQEEALAYELAAKHYLARGLERFAQLYMKEAHYCYERWGAMAKVKDLETRYPQFFPQSSDVTYTPIHATSGTTSTRLDSAIDLATVLKASQAISSEIELDRLLCSLMQILIENAGAQTGSLILETSGEWTIEAACELNDSENICTTQVLESMPMANRLPESIIQYVIRTHEPVILHDATHEANFIHEPYIQHNQPRSLLCLPLLNQSKLVGVLYLENQLATGAFTPERSQVLNLLSAQAAIAIENAKLYAQLNASKDRLTQFFEAMPVGIGVVDATGRPCYSNQRSVQLLGKGIDPAVTPDQFAEVYQFYLAGTEQPYPTERMPIIQALSGKRTAVDDLEIHQNSAIIPVEVWGTPIFDEQGNVAYALAAFQDITQRRQAEQLLADYNRTLEQQVAERTAALQRSEAKFRNIFENSQVGIFRNRISDGLILNANQRLTNLLGFDSPEEIIGLEHSIDYFVNPSDRQYAHELMKRDGELRNYEAQLRKRDGTVFWGLLSAYLNAADGYVEGVVADISDRKQTEAALRQSEANYRNLLQTANSVIIRYDPQGRIHYINDYGVKLLGYEEHEILGRTLFETIIPDIETSGRDVKPLVHDLLRNPQLYPQGEGENLCRDGRRVWITWSNQAIFNEQGEVVEILSVGNDITQRRQAEEALQRSETKFRTIFENSQVGICRTRLSDALILDANQRFANLYGFDSPEEIIGIEHTADYYVNPSDRQPFLELLKRDGEVRNFEAQMRKRDGTVFWGLFSSYLNAADGYVEGVIADISDRVSAEVALQASEAELRALVSAIPDPLFVLTAEGRLVEAVEVKPNQLYRPIEEQIGQTLHQIFEKEQADEFLGYVRQVLRTQQTLTVEYSLRIAEQETWFSARIAPIQHEQVIWLARDITLQKQAEAASILEERNRMAREIHDTLAQAFTGILVHMGAISRLAKTNPEAIPTHIQTVRDLARSGLTEARRSVTALRPQLLAEGNLWTALKQFTSSMQSSTETCLICEIVGTPYALPPDTENNLLRIGQEAFTNAIKYAHANEIRIELVYEPTQCCLRIRDDGQGFEVSNITLSQGFGLLGMSERAERIGAQLSIDSQPGQGTEVIVSVHREAGV